jgi:hypothetical protein
MRSQAKEFLTCREARLLVSLYRSADSNVKSLAKMKAFLRNRETGQNCAGVKRMERQYLRGARF